MPGSAYLYSRRRLIYIQPYLAGKLLESVIIVLKIQAVHPSYICREAFKTPQLAKRLQVLELSSS
jgi:hypothetical protein